jgi:hypothetical protein
MKDYDVSGPFALLKHHFRVFVEIVFSMPSIWKLLSNGFPTSWNIASSNSSNLIFNAFRRQIIRLWGSLYYLKHHLCDFIQVAFFRSTAYREWFHKGNSTPWNIASSISQKSFFKTSKGQIMSSQVHSPTWNIIFATSSKWLFWIPRM